MNKKVKQQTKRMFKAGLTPTDVARIRATAERSAKKAEERAGYTATLMTLAMPAMILKEDYWKKADKAKMHKFIMDCYSMLDSYEKNAFGNDELIDFLNNECGVDIIKLQEEAYNDRL